MEKWINRNIDNGFKNGSNHQLLLVGPLDWIQCPHRADVCKSLLVGQDWCVRV